MSAPLPPRPNKLAQEEKPIEELKESPIEKIRIEQQAGKEAVKLSQLRLEQEMEAGRRIVEINERNRRKLTMDSEKG